MCLFLSNSIREYGYCYGCIFDGVGIGEKSSLREGFVVVVVGFVLRSWSRGSSCCG